mgnify:CR=1 FL=1
MQWRHSDLEYVSKIQKPFEDMKVELLCCTVRWSSSCIRLAYTYIQLRLMWSQLMMHKASNQGCKILRCARLFSLWTVSCWTKIWLCTWDLKKKHDQHFLDIFGQIFVKMDVIFLEMFDKNRFSAKVDHCQNTVFTICFMARVFYFVDFYLVNHLVIN